ncbi:MAG: hypothetical protein LBU95_04335 [Rikenellaceae bacterium]|jgi:hypothetical protein|nr:hypothetical protein [Rikenellaceae bacterium]
MKDTVITAAAKRRELWILLWCFVAANLLNIYAIASHGTRWVELFSQIGYVACITGMLYCLTWLGRLIARPFCRKRRG